MAQIWDMLSEDPLEERFVCKVVWNDMCINNAIIGSEISRYVQLYGMIWLFFVCDDHEGFPFMCDRARNLQLLVQQMYNP